MTDLLALSRYAYTSVVDKGDEVYVQLYDTIVVRLMGDYVIVSCGTYPGKRTKLTQKRINAALSALAIYGCVTIKDGEWTLTLNGKKIPFAKSSSGNYDAAGKAYKS